MTITGCSLRIYELSKIDRKVTITIEKRVVITMEASQGVSELGRLAVYRGVVAQTTSRFANFPTFAAGKERQTRGRHPERTTCGLGVVVVGIV